MVVLALALFCQSAFCASEESEPRLPFAIEGRFGYVKRLRDEAPDWYGSSYGVVASYVLYDSLRLSADLEYLLFDNWRQRPKAHALDTALGLRYDVDFLPVYPVVGAGVGLYAEKPKGQAFKTRVDYHLLVAAEGHLSPHWGLGLEFKPHLTQLSRDAYGFYYTLALKVMAFF